MLTLGFDRRVDILGARLSLCVVQQRAAVPLIEAGLVLAFIRIDLNFDHRHLDALPTYRHILICMDDLWYDVEHWQVYRGVELLQSLPRPFKRIA
jgi:hypothetical protein